MRRLRGLPHASGKAFNFLRKGVAILHHRANAALKLVVFSELGAQLSQCWKFPAEVVELLK